MRILLDNCVDIDFKPLLVGHEVVHAVEIGLARIANGQLLQAADDLGFEALITVDKQMRFQQSLLGKRVCVITLNARFILLEFIAPLAGKVLDVLRHPPAGQFVTINPD